MLNSKTPIILVVDNHSAHKADEIKEHVNSTEGMLEIHYLPPYSPQLNPDEQVWKNIKERVSKKTHADKKELRSLLQDALIRLQEMPEIIRFFFCASRV